jgi:Spy/CpxP family protein refolding chaperone
MDFHRFARLAIAGIFAASVFAGSLAQTPARTGKAPFPTGQKKPSVRQQQEGMVNGEVKIYAAKLKLTTAQQTKVRAILIQRLDTMVAIVNDKNMPDKEKSAKYFHARDVSYEKIAKVLTPTQRKKWDAMRRLDPISTRDSKKPKGGH